MTRIARKTRTPAPTSWSVAEAKARFSELLDRVRISGPQTITRSGRPAAIVVSPDEWDRKRRRTGSFAEFILNSPLRNSDLVVERLEGGLREVDL